MKRRAMGWLAAVLAMGAAQADTGPRPEPLPAWENVARGRADPGRVEMLDALTELQPN